MVGKEIIIYMDRFVGLPKSRCKIGSISFTITNPFVVVLESAERVKDTIVTADLCTCNP